jgi:hypothetical protein
MQSSLLIVSVGATMSQVTDRLNRPSAGSSPAASSNSFHNAIICCNLLTRCKNRVFIITLKLILTNKKPYVRRNRLFRHNGFRRLV